MENLFGTLILALETALDGGSAAIFLNGKRIAHAEGADGLSKSEDILSIIENLLRRNGIEKKEIGVIAVSDGPGSLTGVRIGLAIATGLSHALSAKVYKISALEALTRLVNFEGRVISALYSKRIGIFFREFLIRDGKCIVSGDIVQMVNLSDFANMLDRLSSENVSYVFEGNLMRQLTEYFESNKTLDKTKDKTKFFHVEGNFAEIIGLAACVNASDNVKHSQ